MHNHRRKKQQPTISTFFKKVPAKKGDLLLFLPHSEKFSRLVAEGIGTGLFFYQDILHKNKTPKYLNTPKSHNKAHSLGKKCPNKIADKKNNQ